MSETQTRYAPRSRRPFKSASHNPHGGSRHSGRRFNSSTRNQGGVRSHSRGGSRNGRKMPTFNPSQFINKNPVEMVTESYTPTHTFADFKLDRRLVSTVATMGLTTPTPIQDQVIPLILDGKDVVGLAETGTGKTAAFLLPLIEQTKKAPQFQTLILTPTRELALQVEGELKKLAKNFGFFSTVCVGGTNITPQIRSLRRKNHFVIGTPGRVIDLLERGCLQTRGVRAIVLDEADRMLDMGFIHDIKRILSELPDERQTLFFSATMDDKTKMIVNDFMVSPVTVSVKKKDVTNNIKQDVVPFGHHNKFETLLSLLQNEAFERVIIFGAMKHSVEKLAKELSTHGVKAESIHGNKSHGQRQNALNKFKSGNARVLVATDVAARGIHVDRISHVINYDMPNTFEDYVHRIGRTGRGSDRGEALTFVPEEIIRN